MADVVDPDQVKMMVQEAEQAFGQVDIAEACLYLAGDSGAYVSGQAIHVNGGEYMF